MEERSHMIWQILRSAIREKAQTTRDLLGAAGDYQEEKQPIVGESTLPQQVAFG